MSNKRKTLVFINLIITSFSSTLLSTAMIVALPHIAADLNVSLATGQWVTSGFSLAFAIIVPLSAYLINRISTKRLYMISLVLLMAGLAVSAAATTFPVLIAGRIIQAASGAVLGAMAQVILLTIYTKDKHGTVMGWYGLAMGFGPIVAPTISGIIMDLYSWRMVFILSIGIIAVSMIFALLVFDNFLPTKKAPFDIVSFTLSGFAFGGLTLGAGNLPNYGITNPFTFVPLAIGIVTLILFSKRQFALSTPFLDLSLLKDYVFALACISAFLHSFITSGSSILIPTMMQNIYHCSATETGLFMLFPSIVFAAISPVAGTLYDKIGIHKLFMISSVALVIGNGAMVIATEEMSILMLLLLFTLRNAALALLMMPLVTWGMSVVRQEQIAQGTAMMNTLKNVSNAVGSAVIVGFMALIAQTTAASPHAEMYGVNAAFALCTAMSVIMMVIAFFFVKPAKK